MFKDLTVYKRTQDDWFPNYKAQDGLNLVRIHYFKQSCPDCWVIVASGNDDFALRKEFPIEQEKLAWCCFVEIIGQEFVSVGYLVDQLGFKGD